MLVFSFQIIILFWVFQAFVCLLALILEIFANLLIYSLLSFIAELMVTRSTFTLFSWVELATQKLINSGSGCLVIYHNKNQTNSYCVKDLSYCVFDLNGWKYAMLSGWIPSQVKFKQAIYDRWGCWFATFKISQPLFDNK